MASRSPTPLRPRKVNAWPPAADAKLGHFHQAACHQGGLGVVAEAEAIRQARTNGEDVFERPA